MIKKLIKEYKRTVINLGIAFLIGIIGGLIILEIWKRGY